MIIRRIEDVASSFNARALNPKDSWPGENDYRRAVEIWNESLEKAKYAIDSGLAIHLVSYEKLFDNTFNKNDVELSNLLNFLGLSTCRKIIDRHREMNLEYSVKVKPKKKIVLNGQIECINRNSNKYLANELMLY